MPIKVKPEEPKLRAADRIRAIARDQFYRQGIRAVGVDEIVTLAGVTKPSLYRTFPSKDHLAADYLRHYSDEFLQRFDKLAERYPGDPRAQLRDWFGTLAKRATRPAYRGCGLTNATVEYPERNHPTRAVVADNKKELRRRLHDMARQMEATNPDVLADGLLLLMEGSFASGQLFGAGGPAGNVADIAEVLIDAYTRS